MPGYHEVCVSSTNNKGQELHRNADICHLLPEPPSKSKQSFIVLAHDSPPRGVYEAVKVERKKKQVTAWDPSEQRNVQFPFADVVRVLLPDEKI
jgi:hypothetical protein